jgi:hypothetical protein
MSISLPGLEDAAVYLALSSPKTLRDANVALVEEIVRQGFRAVVITVGQPSRILTQVYTRHGIDTSRVSFIDAITKYALGTTPPPQKDTIFVSNPRDLTSLSIAITGMLRTYPEERACYLIDSVTTMLIHLSSEDVSKFIHFASAKLGIMDTPLIFLAAENSLSPILLDHLLTFSSDVIRIEDPLSPQDSSV